MEVGLIEHDARDPDPGSGGERDGPVVIDRAGLFAFLEHLDEVILGVRFDGTIAFAGPSSRALLGWDARGLVGASIFDYMEPERVGEVTEALARWAGRRGSMGGERGRMRAADGRWLDVVYQVSVDDRLGPIGDLAITLRAADGHGAPQLELVERALNEDRLVRLASIFVSYGLGRFDEQLDEAVAELTGLASVARVSVWRVNGDRVVRRSCWSAAHDAPTRTLPRRVPLSRVPRLAALEEVVEQPARLPPSAVGSGLTGSLVQSLVAIPMSAGGRFTGFTMIESTLPGPRFDASHFATLRIATSIMAEAFERHELERELASRAATDELTGLANRWTFQAAVDQARVAVAEGGSAGLAVALVDLDRFKVINDSIGHDAGDRLLIDVAHRLRTAVGRWRFGGALARLGGDEFLLLAERCPTAEGAVKVVTETLDVLQRPFDLHGRPVHLSASVGLVHTTSSQPSTTELLRRADLAMYESKALGGGRIVVGAVSAQRVVVSQMTEEADLREAVERGHLELFHQGEWDLRTGALLGAEALVRWRHPVRGLLAAGSFIPLAEESSIIVSIGSWVLTRACEHLRDWTRLGLAHDFVLRVNIAARQLQEPGFVEDIREVLEETGVAPRQLCLELTESSFLIDPDGAVAALEDVRRLGVGIAIDDFGTGFSSMLYLKQLPLTALKIDRAFITGLPTDARDRAIVASIVRLANEIGITVTGEGVETPEQVTVLVELGCHRAQGFLLSKPEPVDEFTERLRSHR